MNILADLRYLLDLPGWGFVGRLGLIVVLVLAALFGLLVFLGIVEGKGVNQNEQDGADDG